MESNVAIELKSISKKFDLKTTSFYGGQIKIGTKQIFTDLTVTINKGEIVGLIGRNGAGKSTLLKIIAGIMYPDSGICTYSGNVASVLELGMGFDNELSGYENIVQRCGLYGLTNEEINEAMPEIVKQSELGEQLDYPLRTYSSGMVAKLSFALLSHLKCDILILDEILSIGDANFNIKTKQILSKLKKAGKTIIVASHNLNTIESLCTKVAWVDGGVIRMYGDPTKVCHLFKSELTDSFETVSQLANGGDVDYLNRAAIMLRDGIDTPQDIEYSKKLLKKSIECGSIEARYIYANILESEGKLDEALENYKIASEEGSVEATYSVNRLSSSIKDEIEDFLKRVEDEVNNGNIKSTRLLADILRAGVICKKDLVRSFELYHRSNKYSPSIQYILGVSYRDGLGVLKDIEKSLEWLEKSANNGYNKARIELANMYRKGIGVEKDLNLSIKWFTCAAKCGDTNAMIQLGNIYLEKGESIENISESKFWFANALSYTLSVCENNFGDIIKQSYSGEKQKECINWYLSSAKKGNPVAMANLGNIYNDGGIALANNQESVDWYCQAASLGNIVGLIESSICFLKSNGVPRDVDKALELLQKASETGNTNAMNLLFQVSLSKPEIINDVSFMLKMLSESGNMLARSMLGEEKREHKL